MLRGFMDDLSKVNFERILRYISLKHFLPIQIWIGLFIVQNST